MAQHCVESPGHQVAKTRCQAAPRYSAMMCHGIVTHCNGLLLYLICWNHGCDSDFQILRSWLIASASALGPVMNNWILWSGDWKLPTIKIPGKFSIARPDLKKSNLLSRAKRLVQDTSYHPPRRRCGQASWFETSTKGSGSSGKSKLVGAWDSDRKSELLRLSTNKMEPWLYECLNTQQQTFMNLWTWNKTQLAMALWMFFLSIVFLHS